MLPENKSWNKYEQPNPGKVHNTVQAVIRSALFF